MEVRVRKQRKLLSVLAASILAVVGAAFVFIGGFILLSGVILESAGIVLGYIGLILVIKANEIWEKQ